MLPDFTSAVREFEQPMLRRATRLVGDRDFIEPEDVVQEAWATAWMQRDWVFEHPTRGSIAGRLMHILKQAFIQMLRRLQRSKRSGDTEPLDSVMPSLSVEATQPLTVLARQVLAAVSRLRPAQVRALAGHAVGMNAAEIARVEGVSRQRIQQHVAAGRKILKGEFS